MNALFPTSQELLSKVSAAAALSPGLLIQSAYEAIDAGGFDPGAMSGGPRAIWERFVRTVLIPAVEQAQAEFDAAVVRAIAAFAKDEFSGPLTATVVFAAGTTDALIKLGPKLLQGHLDVSQLSATDWVMMSFAFAIAYNGGASKRE
jgi:hypothetical protein